MVLAGPTQPAHVHAVCHGINERLGNTGKSVRAHRLSLVSHEPQLESFRNNFV